MSSKETFVPNNSPHDHNHRRTFFHIYYSPIRSSYHNERNKKAYQLTLRRRSIHVWELLFPVTLLTPFQFNATTYKRILLEIKHIYYTDKKINKLISSQQLQLINSSMYKKPYVKTEQGRKLMLIPSVAIELNTLRSRRSNEVSFFLLQSIQNLPLVLSQK
jgi:hypothetical protein